MLDPTQQEHANNDALRRKKAREDRIRAALRTDFEFYSERCLKILSKPSNIGADGKKKVNNTNRRLMPFKWNAPQRYLASVVDKQLEETGKVRIIVLKGRQQGISTWVGGRLYWKTTTRKGERSYILTHQQQATDNLFAITRRYHDENHPSMKPHLGKSNKQELQFDKLDSAYQVNTAGSKGSGRSATLTNAHLSEVAFWENDEEHLGGLLEAVPDAPGTEIYMESTARGLGNVFYRQWMLATRGESDFIAVFIPWFWSPEYRRALPPGFKLDGDPESVPEGELTEVEYAETYKLDHEQMAWRRAKIQNFGGGERGLFTFKQEYPATPDEAFQSADVQAFMPRLAVAKARKSDVATPGPLLMGFDPASGRGGDDPALVRRRTRRVFAPQRLAKLNTMQQVAFLHNAIKTEKPHKLFIDVGGMGIVIYDRLMELEGTQGIVVAVNFGEQAFNPVDFVNRKAEMAWEFREWIEAPGGANIPDDDDYQQDIMISVEDDPDSNSRRRLKSKKWLRAQGHPSPDMFDATCLTFAEPVAGVVGNTGQADTEFEVFGSEFDDYSGGGNTGEWDVF